LPDSTILVDYMLNKSIDLIERLKVYPERMMKNIESTGGLVFSGQLLLDLAEAGMLREDAYRLVQKNAMRAWNEDLNFRKLIMDEPEIRKLVPRDKLDRAFDLTRQLRNVDKIFERVFGQDERAERTEPAARRKPLPKPRKTKRRK
jgi:adenylosuccinate lyase